MTETKSPLKMRSSELLLLRLYVVGKSPVSVRAISNLKAICDSYPAIEIKVEIVDVLNDPARTLKDGILATPTLIKVSPSPSSRIIGDLSETLRVLNALGLEKATI